MQENAKGITLVALIITIIILLILAGVTISLVIGENGLIEKSKQSVGKYKEKAKEEQWQLEDLEAGMEELKDEEEHPELKQMKLVLNITEDNKEIQLPVYQYTDENYTYDCTVNWGDEITEQVTNENAKTTKHTYGTTGEYTVVIEGIYERLYVNWQIESMQKALKKVEQWGATGVKNIYLEGCTNLEEIAEPSKNSFSNVTSFEGTFDGCSSLISLPERLFANCPNVTSFEGTFDGCSSLTSLPKRLFANCPNVTSFEGAFDGCSSLTSLPERLFANCSNVTSFDSTFDGCSSLTSLPERLFANCPNVTSFDSTFERCSALTSIPKRLFANCSKIETFGYTFGWCTNLSGESLQLWKEGRTGIDEENGGFGCYAQCEKLDDFEEIPSYWKDYED